MDVKQEEFDKYHRVWDDPLYRVKSHSLDLWNDYPEYFPTFNSALDIGCGLGMLYGLWNVIGYDAWGVDHVPNCLQHGISEHWKHKFSQQCLWEMQFDRTFDFGICTDVMEHIPAEKVHLTLQSIAECCNQVLFKIAHYPSMCNLGGPPLHLTLESSFWWTQEMIKVGGNAKELEFHSAKDKPDSVILWNLS